MLTIISTKNINNNNSINTTDINNIFNYDINAININNIIN